MKFWKKKNQESPMGLPTKSETLFQATFIFGTSQFELSYGHLKFFHHKFWRLKIYGKSIQCKNSTMRYILKEVVTKKFVLKTNF